MKRAMYLMVVAALMLGTAANASAQQTKAEQRAAKKEAFVDHLENHFKFYGFVRNYFAFDTRESTAGTGDLYYYMPKDESIVDGIDLNAIPSFRYLSLTSRVGVDITGYEISGYKLGGKIEADFYAGISGVTGTAQLRLRQAYATVAKDWRSWKIGQAWHPMAADLPDIFSLESGAPFGPFSRTPQVTADFTLGKGFSLTASLIWQMQYTSTGPSLTKGDDGVWNYKTAAASADYIKYSCTPETYLGFNYKNDNLLFRLGGEVLSIKPRKYDYDLSTGKALHKVSDRLTTWTVFFYGQEKAGNWTFKEKVTYANDGSHMNLVGGYGVSKVNADGSWEYSATRSLSAWATIAWKKGKWQPSILGGYIKEFGTSEDLVGNFWGKNSAGSLNQMYRIQPEVLYTLGKFQIGLEYMYTAVQYGKNGASLRKVVTENIHWVGNHRVQAMVKFNF